MNKQISFYFKMFLFLLISILLDIPLVYFLMPNIPDILTEIIPFRQFTPALAYLIIILIFKDIYIPIVIKPNKYFIKKLLIGILIPAIVIGSITIGTHIIDRSWSIIRNPLNVTPILVINIILGTLGEEIGWRSFLLTSFEKKHNVLLSSIIVGIMWFLWHTNRWLWGMYYVVAHLLIAVFFTIIMVTILKDTKNNLIIAMGLHSSINLAEEVFHIDLNYIIIGFFVTAIICIIIERKYFMKAKVEIT